MQCFPSFACLALFLWAGFGLARRLLPSEGVDVQLPLGCSFSLALLEVLPALAALTIRLLPGDVFERNRARAAGMWRDGRPKKWYFALPIVSLWLLAALLIARALLR